MFSKHTSGTARKRIVFFLGVLLAVNATVAHIITNQISDASNPYQVKDEHVVVEEAVAEDENLGTQEEDASSITIYTVKQGDTISGIAKKFSVSENTILWANELTRKSTLKIGQALVILPINGIRYKVTKGDTISGIAAKFDADADEILYFNDLDDPKSIKPGMDLIIPGAEPIVKKSVPAVKPTTPKQPTPLSAFPEKDTNNHESSTDGQEENNDEQPVSNPGRYGIFVPPAPGSTLTQGYHAVNAVDFGGLPGSSILAAAEGVVIVAKGGCPANGNPRSRCNGGFGNFVVISHNNGIQTLYAHLLSVSVSVGDSVDQGEKIGSMGDSGKSTGTHLHFETHGIKNSFTKDRKFTKY